MSEVPGMQYMCVESYRYIHQIETGTIAEAIGGSEKEVILTILDPAEGTELKTGDRCHVPRETFGKLWKPY